MSPLPRFAHHSRAASNCTTFERSSQCPLFRLGVLSKSRAHTEHAVENETFRPQKISHQRAAGTSTTCYPVSAIGKSVGMPSSPSDSTTNLLLTTKESKPQWRDCPPCLSKTPGGLAPVASSTSPDECSHPKITQESKKSVTDGHE